MYDLLINPNENFYTTRRKTISNIVLHVTAGLEDLDMLGVDNSAEATNRYGATTSREASWHSCVDSDSIAPALPDAYTAFHCRNYNSGTLGLEICNRDARWDNKPDVWVEATLRNAARVALAWEKAHKIPRVLRTKAEVDANKWGYTYHSYLDPERRSDPGKTFPWTRFTEILHNLSEGFVVPTPLPSGVNREKTKQIQRLLKLTSDGLWGSKTDLRADLMVKASRAIVGWPVKTPGVYHVAGVQYVIGTTIDGIWGPKSLTALIEWVKSMQRVLGQSVDGSWGPKTDNAFNVIRQANLGRF